MRYLERTPAVAIAKLNELFKSPEFTLCYCPTDKMRGDIHTKPVTNSRKWKDMIHQAGLTNHEMLTKKHVFIR